MEYGGRAIGSGRQGERKGRTCHCPILLLTLFSHTDGDSQSQNHVDRVVREGYREWEAGREEGENIALCYSSTHPVQPHRW